MADEELIEKMAQAIYDAEDPLSGDHIATVIHLSDHFFPPDDSTMEAQLAGVMVICRAAAKAALTVCREEEA